MSRRRIAQPSELHTVLGFRPTFDYVAAVCDASQGHALITKSWGFARRETEAIRASLGGEEIHSPPFDYHELQREGRRSWNHFGPDGRRVALARLFCKDPESYGQDELRLFAVLGLSGVPVLFVALADRDQIADLRRSAEGRLSIRQFTLHDFRGQLPRSQDPNMRQLAEGLIHPVLPLPGETPSQFPSISQLPLAG